MSEIHEQMVIDTERDLRNAQIFSSFLDAIIINTNLEIADENNPNSR